MSMKPGATAQPDASSSCVPCRLEPMSPITPSTIATSATRPGAPVPSKTVPPRMTTSADMPGLLWVLGLLWVGDELEQVAVRVAHVDARAGGLATALPLGRAFDDLDPGAVEERGQRGHRSVPHEAEVPARRSRRRRPER